MTRGGSWIALIERPINQAIKKHRRRACKHHADDDQQQGSYRRGAIRGHDERAKGKWEGKNRVGKTNQMEKPRQRLAGSDLCLTLSIVRVHKQRDQRSPSSN